MVQVAVANKRRVKIKKKSHVTSDGYVFIKNSEGNIIISITNNKKQIIVGSSAGKVGFKGTKKSTPYAAEVVAEDVAKKAFSMGITTIIAVFLKGIGMAKERALMTLNRNGLKILRIVEKEELPYGGCRPRKKKSG